MLDLAARKTSFHWAGTKDSAALKKDRNSKIRFSKNFLLKNSDQMREINLQQHHPLSMKGWWN
jgi:hypothetical protein